MGGLLFLTTNGAVSLKDTVGRLIEDYLRRAM